MVSFSQIRILSLIGLLNITISISAASADGRMKFDYKEPPSAGIAAKVGGVDITSDELEAENQGSFQKLRGEEYELRMNALKNVAVKKLMGVEATKKGMTLEDYIQKEIIGEKLNITDAEISAFAKEKGIPTEKMTPDLAIRVKEFLKAQGAQKAIETHLASLTAKNPIQVYFSKPKGVQIEIAKSPTWGKANAPVTLVVFSDFQCPYCAQGAKNMTEVKKKYGDKVQLVFKHLPLPMHPQAKGAAVASLCVSDQSSEKFWKFHDLLFANQQKLGDTELATFATQVGADAAKYKECVDSKRHDADIAADMMAAEKFGIQSTPTFYLNGQLVSGAQPVEAFSQMIDEVLAEKQAG